MHPLALSNCTAHPTYPLKLNLQPTSTYLALSRVLPNCASLTFSFRRASHIWCPCLKPSYSYFLRLSFGSSFRFSIHHPEHSTPIPQLIQAYSDICVIWVCDARVSLAIGVQVNRGANVPTDLCRISLQHRVVMNVFYPLKRLLSYLK